MPTIISRTCPICGTPQTIEVNTVDYYKYRNGALVQDAFPYLSPDQREVIITGFCATCWNKVIKEND